MTIVTEALSFIILVTYNIVLLQCENCHRGSLHKEKGTANKPFSYNLQLHAEPARDSSFLALYWYQGATWVCETGI
jgi:hypothetical protein